MALLLAGGAGIVPALILGLVAVCNVHTARPLPGASATNRARAIPFPAWGLLRPGTL